MALSTRRSTPQQFTYILRVWETRSIPPDPSAKWSASLEDVDSGQTTGFPTLEALVAFLRGLPTGVEAKDRVCEQGRTSE